MIKFVKSVEKNFAMENVAMAYDRKEIIKRMFEIIPEKKICRINSLCAHVGISEPVFYEWQKTNIEDFKNIKDALIKENVKKYDQVEAKLYSLDSAAGLICLLKLHGTKEQRMILSDRSEESEQIEKNKGKILEWIESQISEAKDAK